MRKIKTKLLIGLIAILSMSAVGCSDAKSEESKETISQSNSKEKMVDIVDGKYFATMPYKDEKGDKVCGYVAYFEDGKMNLNIIPHFGDKIKYENKSTNITDDSIEYIIEETNKGEKSSRIFKILREQNNKLEYCWTSTVPTSLDLINKDEFEKIISEHYPELYLDEYVQEFSDVYKVDLAGIAGSQSSEDQVSANSNQSQEVTTTETESVSQSSYSTKEAAMARAKEIGDSMGLLVTTNDMVTSTTTFEGRECWEFYIGNGEGRVEFIYIDVMTGQFKETYNPSSDWRMEW